MSVVDVNFGNPDEEPTEEELRAIEMELELEDDLGHWDDFTDVAPVEYVPNDDRVDGLELEDEYRDVD